MNTRFVPLLFALFLQACGSEKPSSATVLEEGKGLIDSNDCKTCHHTTNKIMGPAYSDIAKKYSSTDEHVTMLAERIIKGGSGNWGEIPMNAHTDISLEAAEKMAWYVLSLSDTE